MRFSTIFTVVMSAFLASAAALPVAAPEPEPAQAATAKPGVSVYNVLLPYRFRC